MFEIYIYTHPLFFRFFSHIDYHRILDRVPCAIQQVPIGQSFHIPQFVCTNPTPPVCPSPHPPPPVPFGNGKFFKACESVSVLQISSFVSFFLDSTYKRYHMMFVFHCLTSLSMIISRSMHVAVNGCISFFFTAE